MLFLFLAIFIVALLLVSWIFWQYISWRRRLPSPDYRNLDKSPQPELWNHTAHLAWLGHSTLLLRLHKSTILTDPVLYERVGVRIGPWVIGPKRYTPLALPLSRLPKPDLVLLSHAHLDHWDVRSLRAVLSPDTTVVVPQGTAQLIRRIGKGKVIELAVQETVSLEEGLQITAIPVKHWGNRYPWNRHYGFCGYLIRLKDRSVFFAGDTAHVSTFSALRDVGELDVACIPIGAYNPAHFQGAHCTPEQAWDMFLQTGARYMVPIHWGTFVLSQEPVDEPMTRLLQEAGSEEGRIVIRNIGEEFSWS
ncbi:MULTISPECIES: MBL fold metallo-hydrolase [Alicyclobacillus]|nr:MULTISPECIES: MBL fold metallo-hydrolase [Alicyclobacillus]MDP9727524.1 L-ascorbate metabolism protein UlaG (beta-lactamase superfamily) [Alicyclobacillus tengchongensis]